MNNKRWLVTGFTLAILLNLVFLFILVLDMKYDNKAQHMHREDLRQVSHLLSVMQSGKGKELAALSRVELSMSKFEKLEEFEIVDVRVYPTKDTSFFTVATKRNGKMFRESIQLIEGKVAGWITIE